jgi:hypothetical protein
MLLLPHEVILLCALTVAFLANPPIEWFLGWLRSQGRVAGHRTTRELGIPPWITGTFERLLSFGLVYLSVPEAGTLLAFWIGAKLASNWQRITASRATRVQAFAALITGTVSVIVGATAGAIAQHFIPLSTLYAPL